MPGRAAAPGQRPVLGQPGGAAPVEQAHVADTVEHGDPGAEGGEPVVAVAVEDDGRVIIGPGALQQLLEAVAWHDVAALLVEEIAPPVEAQCAGDRRGRRIRVEIHLQDDGRRRRAEPPREPGGAHEMGAVPVAGRDPSPQEGIFFNIIGVHVALLSQRQTVPGHTGTARERDSKLPD